MPWKFVPDFTKAFSLHTILLDVLVHVCHMFFRSESTVFLLQTERTTGAIQVLRNADGGGVGVVKFSGKSVTKV